MKTIHTVTRLTPWLLLLIPLVALAEETPNAQQIMARAYQVYAGDDMVSRLTFTLRDGETEKKLGLRMAYKSYGGKKGLQSKTIMFNEFPPDKRDISFLAWIYTPEKNRKDDMWLYLPELRTVRKLTHQHKAGKHGHHDKDSEDEFSLSELQRFELQPRDPALDHHELQGTEHVDGQPVYKILSTPRDDKDAPFGKIVYDITTDHYLPVRATYYDARGAVIKRLTMEWTPVGKAWIWKRVMAVNPNNGHETILEQDDVKLNTGLSDNIFTKRFMKLGARTLMSRVK
ncbi:MAG TPA: outer membrane lipoprotein-sorting protein [Gammaproteobacteria bacterium]|nr:outer membrane lipoprotein-sorting protein [Gammaproteobacteria bacterium]